ncbi:MAG TPA: DUF1552 domain-containing protein [Polyangiaceae bacterium]|jgi:hypothetical protein|nr:DUF1552 domain-containing protein [Polyangiaceae bacterium]
MNRRRFLQGAGGAALMAPFLPSLLPKAARAQSAFPTRMVMYFTHNGCLLDNYRKTDRTGALDLSGLSTFEPLVGMEQKMLQIRGLAMFPRGTNVTVGGTTIYFDPHDQGTGSKLTAAYNDPDNKWAMGRSFDHVIAELVNPGADKTPLVYSSTPVGFQDVKTVLSYKVAGDGKAFTPESNPGKIYSTLTGLFGQGMAAGPATEADYQVLRGKSILDVTSEELKSLQAKQAMSAADKARLEAWAELLLSTEKVIVPGSCNADAATALGISEDSIKAAGGTVTTGSSSSGGGGGFGGGGFGGGNVADQMNTGMAMLQNLAALTMICDANRVILQHNQSFITFDFDGIDAPADHHGISHRTGSAAVGGDTYDPEYYEPFIKKIDAWYGNKYAQLVKLLDSIPEGDGTLLDNTATIWLPELGDGEQHNNDDLPITIAGSMGGFLKTGQIVDAAPPSSGGGGGGFAAFGSGGTPLNKFYVALAQGLGAADFSEFGLADSNDVDQGITNPGPLTEILTAS